MKDWLVQLLRDPEDGSALRREGDFLVSGAGRRFPVIRGVPRFVPSDSYAGSFGYQWNRFARTQLDSASGGTQSRDTFVEKTGIPLCGLEGQDDPRRRMRHGPLRRSGGRGGRPDRRDRPFERRGRGGAQPRPIRERRCRAGGRVLAPVRARDVRPDLQHRRAASHARHAQGLPEPAEVPEAGRPDRGLALRAHAALDARDEPPLPARHDAHVEGPAPAPLPHRRPARPVRAERPDRDARAVHLSGQQPPAARVADSRHLRLVLAALPVDAHGRGGRRVVPRGRPRPHLARPVPGLRPRRTGV